jgi:hypothetical protein
MSPTHDSPAEAAALFAAGYNCAQSVCATCAIRGSSRLASFPRFIESRSS